MPKEWKLYDPRTWFRWRPAIEVRGIGPAFITTDGILARQKEKPLKSSIDEGVWTNFKFGIKEREDIPVVARGVLHFRIVRRYEHVLLLEGDRRAEVVFTSSMHMWHDFFSKGCPSEIVRSVLYEEGPGEARVVGEITVSCRVCGPARCRESTQQQVPVLPPRASDSPEAAMSVTSTAPTELAMTTTAPTTTSTTTQTR